MSSGFSEITTHDITSGAPAALVSLAVYPRDTTLCNFFTYASSLALRSLYNGECGCEKRKITISYSIVDMELCERCMSLVDKKE